MLENECLDFKSWQESKEGNKTKSAKIFCSCTERMVRNPRIMSSFKDVICYECPKCKNKIFIEIIEKLPEREN